MTDLIRRLLSYKLLPIGWTLLIIVLLCLPGSMVPGTGFFSVKNLDKVVHLVLFGVHVLLWGWHYREGDRSRGQLNRITLFIVAATVILGIVMEYVQLNFIPNRSFDGGDVVADALGAVLAGVWLFRN